MILWDLRAGIFTPGQWVAARIYERKCDLCPDGHRFIYSARGGGKDLRPSDSAYSAISNPPEFTAKSFWRFSTTYGGGGLFIDNRTFWCVGARCADALRTEPGLKQIEAYQPDGPAPQDRERQFDLIHWRLLRDGWVMDGPVYKLHRTGWTLEKSFDPLFERHLLHHEAGAIIDGETWEWATLFSDDLLYASAGGIWRQPLPTKARTAECLPPPCRLADFSDMEPPMLSQ